MSEFTGDILIRINGTLTGTAESDYDTSKITINKEWTQDIANGTGDDQANELWFDTRTLAGTSEELDLYGSLTNKLGETIEFVRVQFVYIENTSTTSGDDLTIFGAASNQWSDPVADTSDKIVLKPGQPFVLGGFTDGYGVTAGTADKLKIDAGANTITYDIIMIGTT